MWGEMLRPRILESYSPPNEQYFHRTQEEIDEEAEDFMLAAGNESEQEELEYQIYLFYILHLSIGP